MLSYPQELELASNWTDGGDEWVEDGLMYRQTWKLKYFFRLSFNLEKLMG